MDGLFTVKYGSFINVGASWGPRKNGMCTSLGEFQVLWAFIGDINQQYMGIAKQQVHRRRAPIT